MGSFEPVSFLLGCAIAGLAAVLFRTFSTRRAHDSAPEGAQRATEDDFEAFGKVLDQHAMVNVSDENGRLTHVNDTFVTITGYDRDELIGRRLSDFLLTSQAAETQSVLDAIAATGRWTGETELRRKDGTTFWTRTTIVALPGAPRRTVSLRTDISDSKRRMAEQQTRLLLEHMSDEVFLFNVSDLALVYVNRKALGVLNWPPEGYRGRYLRDTVENFDEADFRKRTAPLLAGEVESHVYESRHLGRAVEIVLQLQSSLGGPLRFLAVVRDITQRKKDEEARANFVATVSHELRSPLTSVMGALRLANTGVLGPLPKRASDMLSLAQRNVDHLLVLINDLLDLERLEAGEMPMRFETIELSEVVAEAITAIAPYADDLRVGFRFAPDGGCYRIRGDRVRFIQVLHNLLSNAAKFSAAGETVDVEVTGTDSRVRLVVRDRGVGIPEAAQPFVFQRFSQSAPSIARNRPGSGLGLSIVKTIVERHGGTVGFESREGAGTTFWIDLPRTSAH